MYGCRLLCDKNMENIKTKNQLKKFMRERKFLVWYVKNPENLNVESIVEHTLNYGDWDDVQKLIKILGIKKIAEVFNLFFSFIYLFNSTSYLDQIQEVVLFYGAGDRT